MTTHPNNKLSSRFWVLIITVSVLSSIIALSITRANLTPGDTIPQSDTSTNSSSRQTTVPSNQENSASGTLDSNSNSHTPSSSSKSEQTEPQNSAPVSSSNPTPTQTYDYTTSPSCLHFEAGRCWDDIEDEAYSAGLYDKQFGRYGTSFEYDDNCDAICRDIIEDAYDEGWYDSY